ncbi:MAG: PAS domain S-box protein [Methylobacterium frigidaeris]
MAEAVLREKSQIEAALRVSEERQAFLLKLSDALRQLEEPSEIQQVSCRLLRQQIGAMRVAWGEMLPDGVTCVAMGEDMTDGVYSLAGRTWDWNEFDPAGLAALKRGETIYREDVQSAADLEPGLKATFATYGFQAFINVPLVKQGRLEAFLLAHWPTPHRFTPTEIAWMEETTERTAASVQRAQAKVALQESEARLAAAFGSVPAGIGVVSTDGAVIIANEHLRRYLPSDAIPSRDPSVLPRWRAWDEQGRPLRPDDFPGARALRGERVVPGQEMLFTQEEGQEIWTQVASVPIRDAAGRVTAAATVISDIDELKRTSQALQTGEKRQAFLLKLSDALRPLTDAADIQETATRVLGEHLGVRAVNYGLIEAVGGVDYYLIDRAYVAPGRRSTLGRWPFDDFPGVTVALRAGETMVVNEVARAPDLMPRDKAGLASNDVAAYMLVPLVKNKRLTAMLGVVEDKPRAWTAAETALVQEVAERTWAAVERARAEAALRESEARFQQFAKASAAGLWIRDADTLAMEFVSPAIGTIYGVAPDALLGDVKRWAAMIVPEDREAVLGHLEAARRGEATTHEFRIQRPSDGAFRWIRNTGFPLRDDGHIPRIGGIAEDVTEVRLAAEHSAILLAELQHRVRNIMAMIRSVTRRTGERAASVSDYAELLMGRLLALARVQALLTRAANVSVGIAGLVRDEVSVQAQHEGQYDLDGPDVALSPKAAEVLTLAVHELATNALKYGALSVADGKVRVRWVIVEKRGSPWLVFDWAEEGAPERPQPAQDTPRRRGFGSELIEARVPYELRGRGKVTIEPGGGPLSFGISAQGERQHPGDRSAAAHDGLRRGARYDRWAGSHGSPRLGGRGRLLSRDGRRTGLGGRRGDDHGSVRDRGGCASGDGRAAA